MTWMRPYHFTAFRSSAGPVESLEGSRIMIRAEDDSNLIKVLITLMLRMIF